MSASLSIGLVGVSTQSILLRPSIAASRLAGSRHVDLGGLDAHRLHHLVEDAEGAAVDVVAGDDVVARATGCGGESWHRRAAGGEGDAVLRALERREAGSSVWRVGLPVREYSKPLCLPGPVLRVGGGEVRWAA